MRPACGTSMLQQSWTQGAQSCEAYSNRLCLRRIICTTALCPCCGNDMCILAFGGILDLLRKVRNSCCHMLVLTMLLCLREEFEELLGIKQPGPKGGGGRLSEL